MCTSAPKLIFLDIDGTLVRPGQSVPPATALQAIHGAQANGHKVALCTGRSLGMVGAFLPYGFDAVVASAGGHITCGEQLLYDHPMRPDQLQRARAAFAASGLGFVLECCGDSFANELFRDSVVVPASAPNSEIARWRAEAQKAMGIRPLEEYAGQPVYKISFMGRQAHPLDGPAFEALRQEFTFCLHEPGTFGNFNGEIINKAFNKGDAVRRVAAYFGIPLADTIAFGDSMNDYEMIVTAGCGICMGNGSAALKQAADEVCGTVDEDGLYRAFAAHGLL